MLDKAFQAVLYLADVNGDGAADGAPVPVVKHQGLNHGLQIAHFRGEEEEEATIFASSSSQVLAWRNAKALIDDARKRFIDKANEPVTTNEFMGRMKVFQAQRGVVVPYRVVLVRIRPLAGRLAVPRRLLPPARRAAPLMASAR